MNRSRTNVAGRRLHRGGWRSGIKEEDRAEPDPGDSRVAIHPGVIGPHEPTLGDFHLQPASSCHRVCGQAHLKMLAHCPKDDCQAIHAGVTRGRQQAVQTLAWLGGHGCEFLKPDGRVDKIPQTAR